MDVAREKLLNDLLVRAFDRTSAERRPFLDEACRGDAELLEEALTYLDQEDEISDFLEQPALAPGSAGIDPQATEQIGPFRILELLGEGGMGAVYLAEQTEPVRRQVALKLIRSSLKGSEANARFTAERQAMAMLVHPNIGQMLEAGTTEDGFPYFVMELVSGQPITEYCDQEALTIQERLELFNAVCRGVQHAHQNQIIHRDLKPSNILVTKVDGRPVPKIIDFGVAKALDRPLTDVTVATGQNMIGTPSYMSPEALQVSLRPTEGPGVDTRTDIYTLGILLYRLLTGEHPFETRGLNYYQVGRRTMDEEAPRPSRRFSSLDEKTRADAARQRRIEASALIRLLADDLDWIVLKAIAKDRDDRYGSAAEFAADVDRSLSHEPVTARPPRASYLARKFVRRHRVGVALAVVVIVALSAATAFTALSLVRARQARAEAVAEGERADREAEATRYVRDFLVSLFEASDARQEQGDPVTTKELLDRGTRKIEDELGDQPLVQAQLMTTLGAVYAHFAFHSQAEDLYRRSLAIQQEALPGNAADLRATRRAYAALLRATGRDDEAARLEAGAGRQAPTTR